MKNVFDLNLETQSHDGDAFLTGRVSPETARQTDAAVQQVQQFQKKSALPPVLRVVEWASLVIGICIMRGATKALSKNDLTFAEGFRNAPVVYVLALVCVVVFLTLWGVGKYRSKHAVKTTDVGAMHMDFDAVMQRIREELQIPEDALDVDILSSEYTMEDGKLHVKNKGWYHFCNREMAVYRKGDKLCFSDYRREWSIPLAEICGVKQVHKKVQVSCWNKNEPASDPKYKPYKPIDNGSVYVKAYSSIQIQSMWGEFEILTPNYDTAAVMQLAGLTAMA